MFESLTGVLQQLLENVEQADRVAFFGSFTYKSHTTGRQITSPFSLLARFQDGKVI